MDVFGVAMLSLFLGGAAWLFIAAGFLGEFRGRFWAGWLVVGLLFLVGFIWRYFIRAEITAEAVGGHKPDSHRETPGT